MKIVHVLDNLERGGAQTVLRSLVAGLSRRGHEQHLVVLNENYEPGVVADMQAAGAAVTIIGRPRLYAGIGFWQLTRLLRRLEPDWVHTLLPWGDLIGRTCARQAGLRRIISTVTARYADKPRWQLALDRATIGWAERVVFQSAEIIPFSQAREGVRPEQVRCIPNGVERTAPVLPRRCAGSMAAEPGKWWAWSRACIRRRRTPICCGRIGPRGKNFPTRHCG